MFQRNDEALEPERSKNESPTHKQIAKFAYEIWLAEGKPNGRAVDHWVRSELMLTAAFEMKFHRNTTRLEHES